MKIVLISGGWDLMHMGHVETLRNAKSMGDKLIVHAVSDERLRAKKGELRPITPLVERIEILRELRCVDDVFSIPGEEYPLYRAIDYCRPDKVLINVTEQSDVSKEQEYCNNNGVELVRIKRLDQYASTTSILHKLKMVCS